MLGLDRIGRFEILGHLASGGMGQVYLARATGLGGFERDVVVKTLEVDEADEAQLVPMFLDEARLVGALHHQYIAPVYEVGRDHTGRYFLVMDYVHGQTAEAVWRRAIDRETELPLSFSLTVVTAVASALDYAHSLCGADDAPLEIVHRDVSLSNVMLGYDGAVKLIDFGVAKSSRRTTKTAVGALKGKLGYLAPEQIIHRPVDHRADIFALGVVLYELTTMTPAFHAASQLLTLERITRGDVTPPSRLRPGYPRELERIVMKALAVEPDDRFSDAGAMGRELEVFARRIHLPLGHVAIQDAVTTLFDRRNVRRRLARSSTDVATERQLRRSIDDADTAIESPDLIHLIDPIDVDLTPSSDPTIPIPMPAPAAFAVRIAARPRTVTAEVIRSQSQSLSQRHRSWIVIAVVVAIAAVVAALVLS